MPRKVHCERMFIHKDGSVQLIDLKENGGTRYYPLRHMNMGFDEIHDDLRELFSIDPTNRNSKIYDFKYEELDTNQYSTFKKYVTKHGLRFCDTLLYLCTWEDNQQTSASTSSEQRRTTTQAPTKVPKKVPQVEADSSTSSVTIKIENSPPRNHQSTEESILSHRISENLQISSFENYSFNDSLRQLIDYLRHLLTQYNHETIFIQLFEYVCTIQGLSSITSDRLKQQMQSIDKQQNQIYNDAIDKIEKLSRSVKALIELNKMKISHIDKQSIITKSFNQYHQNFNILRDRWNNNVNNNEETIYITSTNDSNNGPPSTSIVHSSSSSRSHTETNSRKQVRPSSPPSSSRPHAETNSRKQTRSPSPAHHQSSSLFRTSSEQNNNERFSLFEALLKSLYRLSDVLRHFHYSSFDSVVRSLITEIESCRTSINLSDIQSLYSAQQLITSTKAYLTKRFSDEYYRASSRGIDRQVESSFDQTLKSIKYLLLSLQYYQDLINKNKRQKKCNWSSPPRQEHTENKSISIPDQDHVKLEDDQSSEASRSSFEDDFLGNIAKDAKNKEQDHFK